MLEGPARVDSDDAPSTDAAVVIGIVILFAVLLVPTVAWVFVRWLPEQRARQKPAARTTGPRKRWWQP